MYVSFESIIFYNSGQTVKFKFWLIRTIHRKHKHELKWKGQLSVRSLHDGKVTLSTGLIKLNFFCSATCKPAPVSGKAEN